MSCSPAFWADKQNTVISSTAAGTSGNCSHSQTVVSNRKIDGISGNIGNVKNVNNLVETELDRERRELNFEVSFSKNHFSTLGLVSYPPPCPPATNLLPLLPPTHLLSMYEYQLLRVNVLGPGDSKIPSMLLVSLEDQEVGLPDLGPFQNFTF